MEEKRFNIESDIADAIMERPIGFYIGDRHFFLHPPSLGKTYILSRLVAELGMNMDILRTNPYLEAMRLCMAKKETVSRIVAYHSLKRKKDILDEHVVNMRAELFSSNLDNKELAKLFAASASFGDAGLFMKHLGLDREKKLRDKVAKIKNKDGGSIVFGGLSTYGTLIDFACQRYGWTMDYVVWGISYLNLKMLISDAITSVYLSKEERKKVHIPDDRTFINADDPRNMGKIRSMDWS